MEDSAIEDLYWERSEQAIPETEHKYGGYCYTVAMRIVNNPEDAEECVNDTWLGAWNSMPENRPSFLAPYLARQTHKHTKLLSGSGFGELLAMWRWVTQFFTVCSCVCLRYVLQYSKICQKSNS